MTYSATEYNLTDLLQDAYRELGQLNHSTVDSTSSATTVVDTKVQDKIGGDDTWKDGTIFIILDATTAGTSPEGKFAIITGWAEATGTFSFATMTDAPASGDQYGYCNDMYPLQQMIELTNDALRMLGDIPLIDTTTLDTAASQTEYAYAIAWKRRPPVKVEVETRADSDDNRWKELHGWEYRPATAGSTGLLVLPQLVAGNDLAVWYMDRHPRVNAYGDEILKAIHPELAKRAVVVKAMQWQNRRMMGGDDFMLQEMQKAEMQLAQAKLEYPIWKPKRKSRLLTLGAVGPEDEFKVPGT